MRNRSPALSYFIAGTSALVALVAVLSIWATRGVGVRAGTDVASLPDTEIVAHPDVPLDPHKNVIWCGSMPLAWNETIAFNNGPLVFDHPEPIADVLKRQEFTKADLDAESYVVMSGRNVDKVDEKFRAELLRKFGDSANPPHMDQADAPANSADIAIYAYLQKNLEFPAPFDVNEPLRFEGKRVASFGFGFESTPHSEAPRELYSEVRLLRYETDDDFIIQLKTKSSGDQFILAKIPPKKTLQETTDSVLPSLKSQNDWGLHSRDKLDVPKIDFDLVKHFKELEGQPIRSIPGAKLNTVAEDVLFRLNEKGVELKVFATITETLAIAANSQPLNLVFDKPFLVLLKREASPRPYFAMWVGNPSLLVGP